VNHHSYQYFSLLSMILSLFQEPVWHRRASNNGGLPSIAGSHRQWVYNYERPNMALGGYTPKQHLERAA